MKENSTVNFRGAWYKKNRLPMYGQAVLLWMKTFLFVNFQNCFSSASTSGSVASPSANAVAEPAAAPILCAAA